MVYLHLCGKIESIVEIFLRKMSFYGFLKKYEGVRVKMYNHLYDLSLWSGKYIFLTYLNLILFKNMVFIPKSSID